jgi:undecaprenyl diphosphate synthase
MIQHLALSAEKIIDPDLFSGKIKEFVRFLIEKRIPVLTIRFPESSSENLKRIMDYFYSWKDVHSKKIKISILGKWYSLNGDVVDLIKKIINDTKDYDGFFLNFCISYDGKEELLEACKIIAKKVENEKLSPEQISIEDIKENIYTSSFIPPDKIIISGEKICLDSFLLWDSSDAEIIFLKEDFENIDIKHII